MKRIINWHHSVYSIYDNLNKNEICASMKHASQKYVRPNSTITTLNIRVGNDINYVDRNVFIFVSVNVRKK